MHSKIIYHASRLRMSHQLEQAKILLKDKKFKKALAQVKKINSKLPEIKFDCLEIESACLFDEKKYILAGIKLKQALPLAHTAEKKFSTLTNLATVQLKLNAPHDAIVYLKQSISIDKTASVQKTKFHLVNLALSIHDHDTIQKYAPDLVNISEHAMFALTALFQTAITLKDKTMGLKYLRQAEGEIRIKGSLEPSHQDIINVLDGYHFFNELKFEANLIQFLTPMYQHETWFQEIKRRTEHSASKVKSIGQSSTKTTKNSDTHTPRILGNSKKTLAIIEKLIKALENMGAVFHPDMRIIEKNGDISVHCACETIATEKFMQVPLHCMPLLNDYRYSLDDSGDLRAIPKKNLINPRASVIMPLLIAFFNATDKLKKWKATYPLFALAGQPKLVETLLRAKSISNKHHKYYAEHTDLITNESVIQSFFGSRTYNFSRKNFRTVAKKFKNDTEKGFIPILELINHKMGAPAFHIDSQTNIMQTFVEPGEAHQQVYVQYNLDDPLITFLTYGFVDTLSPWVYSIPLMINTSAGFDIKISSVIKQVNPNLLPENMKSFAQFVPGNVVRQDNLTQLSSLIIPGGIDTPTLRRVLTHLLQNLDIEGYLANSEQLNEEVKNVEKQVIKQNLIYWHELKSLVLSKQNTIKTEVFKQLQQLCQFNIEHINRYAGQLGIGVKT